METMTETTTSVATGAVTVQMLDLSGKGSHGTIGGVPKTTSADIAKAAAGLGTKIATRGSAAKPLLMASPCTSTGCSGAACFSTDCYGAGGTGWIALVCFNFH